jgi:hypothetical protein
MSQNPEFIGDEPDDENVLEFERDDLIRGLESAGLQLSDLKDSPLEEIKKNIRWVQSLPKDAIIRYDRRTGMFSRKIGEVSCEIAED